MNPNVRLRDVEPDDLPLFFAHQRDPVAVAMVAFQSREADAFDKHWAKILGDETSLIKTVVVEGGVAGNILSFMRDGKREVGYWIDRAYWGRGLATDALSLFLQLEERRPLHAGVAKHNAASVRVLQKCGFTFAGSDGEDPDDTDDSDVLLVLEENEFKNQKARN